MRQDRKHTIRRRNRNTIHRTLPTTKNIPNNSNHRNRSLYQLLHLIPKLSKTRLQHQSSQHHTTKTTNNKKRQTRRQTPLRNAKTRNIPRLIHPRRKHTKNAKPNTNKTQPHGRKNPVQHQNTSITRQKQNHNAILQSIYKKMETKTNAIHGIPRSKHRTKI